MTRDRFPRTMEEAFGPGQRGGLWTEPEPMHPHDRIVVTGCVIAVVALALLAWKGLL